MKVHCVVANLFFSAKPHLLKGTCYANFTFSSFCVTMGVLPVTINVPNMNKSHPFIFCVCKF